MAGKSHHKRKCNKSGHLLRVEPSTADLFEIFPQVAETFSNADWLNFCMSLKGYHPEIATAFIQTFNGFEARVAELTIRVSEDIIACVFDLPLDGERWFRKDKVDESSLNQFLKEDTPKPNWSTGISTKHLQDNWKRVMIVVREYITCEGRYVHLYRLHMCFLLHLAGQERMNLPYFLIKDLTKVSKKIQSNPLTLENSLSHDSLITMLVFDQIRRNEMSIRNFLQNSGFYQKEQLQEIVDKRSKGKKAAFILLPIPEDKTEMPVQKKRKNYGHKSEIKVSSEGMQTRSKTIIQQTCSQVETSLIKIKEQSVNEEAEKQSNPTQETRKRHTRATNKFRLNAKALLDSSLKGKEPIVVEDEPISPVKRKGKKTKAKIEKIPANPNLQTSSSDLLIQLAEVAEFVETKSAEGIVKEACALISNQPEKKSTKSASTKRPRKK